MLYLKNLVVKHHSLREKMNIRFGIIEKMLVELAKLTNKLGRACGTAFGQTKEVINALHSDIDDLDMTSCELDMTSCDVWR